MWGAEGYEASELPRKEFKGVLQVDEETQREELVHGNPLPRYLFKCVSQVVIFLCMLTTVGLAFTAMGLKFKAPKTCSVVVTKVDLGCTKWVLQSIIDGHDAALALDENMTVADFSGLEAQENAMFNEKCCYDVESLHDLEPTLEALAFDNLGFMDSNRWKGISVGSVHFEYDYLN